MLPHAISHRQLLNPNNLTDGMGLAMDWPHLFQFESPFTRLVLFGLASAMNIQLWGIQSASETAYGVIQSVTFGLLGLMSTIRAHRRWQLLPAFCSLWMATFADLLVPEVRFVASFPS